MFSYKNIVGIVFINIRYIPSAVIPKPDAMADWLAKSSLSSDPEGRAIGAILPERKKNNTV